MRKYTILILALVVFLYLFWPYQSSQVDLLPPADGIDMTAIERFWNVADYLEHNTEPPEEAWGALFFTPGYGRLIDTGLDIDAFKSEMTQVFMPSFSGDLEKLNKADLDTSLRHFINIRDHRARYRSYSNHLTEIPILSRSIDLSRKYLPEGIVENYPQPAVAFVFHPMQPDYGKPIITDLVYAHQEGNLFKYHLGHYFHHYYREKLLVFDWAEISPDELDLCWVLDRIQAEGLANQINERYILFGNGPQEDTDRAIEWHIQLLRAPRFIPLLDSMLVEMARHPARRRELGKRIKASLPLEGHAVGYFMASVILGVFYDAGLTRQVGNPFAYLFNYNLAAKSRFSDHPPFSKEAENYILDLERRYVR
ncbi:DUF5700 domain-containing putative Zn-dependent protease [Candidatus Neomarinimicrobiota bacterium]